MEDNIYLKKSEVLNSILKKYYSLTIAFSGGVDSTLLLKVAHDTLGGRVLAVIARSPIHPASELDGALEFIKEAGIRHVVMESREMEDAAFRANTKERCYICKKKLFQDILRISHEAGIKNVAHGANIDDLSDYRPGMKAARELGIVAPLMEAGLDKETIRSLSRAKNLSTADKPAMPCLATRIPCGTTITVDNLRMVEKAEKVLHDFGFLSCRVRYHDSVARIEIPPDDISRMMTEELRHGIVKKIKETGFLHVSLDLEGYSRGSVNDPSLRFTKYPCT